MANSARKWLKTALPSSFTESAKFSTARLDSDRVCTRRQQCNVANRWVTSASIQQQGAGTRSIAAGTRCSSGCNSSKTLVSLTVWRRAYTKSRIMALRESCNPSLFLHVASLAHPAPHLAGSEKLCLHLIARRAHFCRNDVRIVAERRAFPRQLCLLWRR